MCLFFSRAQESSRFETISIVFGRIGVKRSWKSVECRRNKFQLQIFPQIKCLRDVSIEWHSVCSGFLSRVCFFLSLYHRSSSNVLFCIILYRIVGAKTKSELCVSFFCFVLLVYVCVCELNQADTKFNKRFDLQLWKLNFVHIIQRKRRNGKSNRPNQTKKRVL